MQIVQLILLPSLMAFLLLVMTPFYCWEFKRQSGERALLWIFVSGMALNILSAFILQLWRSVPIPSEPGHLRKLYFWFSDIFVYVLSFFTSVLDSAIPQSATDGTGHVSAGGVTATTATSIVLGCIILLACRLWKKFGSTSFDAYSKKCRTHALGFVGQGDPIETLFKVSFKKILPLIFTLKNNKVYVGQVNSEEFFFTPSERQTVSVDVISSGMRDKETGVVTLDKHYLELMQKIDKASAGLPRELKKEIEIAKERLRFGLKIRVSEIVTVAPWVPGVHEAIEMRAPAAPTSPPRRP